jgi:AraC-like DNA-binding protein
VFEGSGELIDEAGGVFAIAPGALVLRFPGRRQELRFRRSPRYAKAYVCMDAAVAPAFTALGVISPLRPVLQAAPDDRILERWLELWRVYERTTKERFFATLIETQRLLADLLARAPEPRKESNDAPWLARACALLSERLEQRFKAEDVAKELGIHYDSFRRVFTQTLSVTPAQYRIQRRIDRACALLPAHTVAETATLLGYPSQGAFSAQFTQLVGRSPKDFQKSTG